MTQDITELKQAQETQRKALQDVHTVWAKSRETLEEQVAQRTAELRRSHELLQAELAERKRVEESLLETQHMLELVINHIPQAIFWKDRNSVFLGCNERFAHDAGFSSPSEMIGKSDFDAVWASHAEKYQIDDRRVMQSGTSLLNFEECTETDIGEIWVRTSKIPLHDKENNVVGILGMYEDISERKEAERAIHEAREEAERANRAKNEFLSRMSHELRTPLNAILGFSQLLETRSQGFTPRQQQSIQQINKAGHHLLKLINEVLDITRVESGRMSQSLEPVQVQELLQESVAMMRPIAEGAGITVTGDISQWCQEYVLADRQRLRQILINLLSNAIKYNRSYGGIDISCTKEEDNALQICVKDTGVGMTAEEMEQLFTPFERLHAANSSIEGTGLGLALSQRLMATMGGSLWAHSIKGQGSSFFIKLPLVSPEFLTPYQDISTDHTEEKHEEDSSLETACYKILSIEDNPANFLLIESIFEERPDIQLLQAIQGGIGVELAQQHQPDLILLDLHLPDINGDEVLRRLHQYPETRDIPVVMISADATPNQIQRLLEAGAQDYLTKPIDVKQLLRVVDNLLQKGKKSLEE
jgi:PAS domain S-box-containing protein